MKKKRFTTIRARVLRLALISIVACVVIIECCVVVFLKNAYTTSYMNETASLASAYSQLISNNINSLALEIEAASKDTSIIDESLSLEERKEKLVSLAETTLFKDFSIAYSDGKTYSDTDISKREYFIEALKGNTYISSPVLRMTDNSVTTMMGALIEKDGQKYVIYGGLDSKLLSNGMAIDMGEGSNIVVIDKTGLVVASSNTDLVTDMVSYTESEDQGLKLLASTMSGGETGNLSYNAGGHSLLAAYQPVPGTDGWTIAVSANTDIINDYIVRDSLICLAISVFIVIVTCIISIKVANRVSKPVVKSTDRLKLLSEGDIESSFTKDNTADETEVMSESLSETIDTLRAYINDIKNVLSAIAAGDLTVDSKVEYKGDFTAIGVALNDISKSLNTAISTVQGSVNHIQIGFRQVAEGAQNLSDTTVRQSEAVNRISNTIITIREKADGTAKASADAYRMADSANINAQDGGRLMGELLEAVEEIKEKAASIRDIIKTIEDISFQTNILALNASIEAARAGEAGKGFAVVADEVGDLAAKSGEAAQSTASLINDSLNAIEKGSELANRATVAINKIVKEINAVSGQMEEITKAADEQLASVNEITEGISEIEMGMTSTTATAEESAASSQEISALAISLAEEVGRFTTK